METVQIYLQQLIAMVVDYTPKVLMALVVLFIGLRIIKLIGRGISAGLKRQGIDDTLRPFLTSLLNWTLKAVLFISVASMIGIKTTSFVAILGAGGLAIGLALQGTLGNFAGGVLIMIFKPIKVGQLIEAQGHLGIVDEIQIFVTKLVTFDNKTIYLPNGTLSNGDITNYSEKGKIRVDLVVGISYESDIKKAKTVLLEAMNNNPKVLSDPAPFVGVDALADSSVNLAVKPWCKPEDYWDIYFSVQEDAKMVLDANKLTIPFPQRDVHLYQHNA